ncbi:MAG: molybdenum cofactor biosynthesis protein MoaE [Bacteroidetes bacterium]|jgi:molybdopterin synthase catalytic subunit|nr:molybdenum cofactor biosynthesis protein MoaE [Bacteroidota bacterium]MBT3747685.1 molybdenum cofactor biosynthesis protein MoaE [Bacteroidota bacterium]MBT4398393.1 molybdenum cofactor biosynthesis protein MoaE [Bacteroidota bacterium]MBT4411815.1 molybdenum cofactor biosynthesis protein MoaE [Bacteroidota bacterium]MBT5427507.1 molybdenum cofactor biosynthesis protein MoaE [Bacteroidota bacterium]
MEASEYLIQGPLSSAFISGILDKADKKQVGAHAFFLGKIRADKVSDKRVVGIEYSAYDNLVTKAVQIITSSLLRKYDDLTDVQIYHSKGLVKVGEISLIVSVSCGHRKQAFAAMEDCVEQIKANLPVWKKELYDDQSHKWLEK